MLSPAAPAASMLLPPQVARFWMPAPISSHLWEDRIMVQAIHQQRAFVASAPRLVGDHRLLGPSCTAANAPALDV